jgi:hypothetical protein
MKEEETSRWHDIGADDSSASRPTQMVFSASKQNVCVQKLQKLSGGNMIFFLRFFPP